MQCYVAHKSSHQMKNLKCQQTHLYRTAPSNSSFPGSNQLCTATRGADQGPDLLRNLLMDFCHFQDQVPCIGVLQNQSLFIDAALLSTPDTLSLALPKLFLLPQPPFPRVPLFSLSSLFLLAL